MAFFSPTESAFTRHYREEVAMVLSTIDCVLNGQPAVYASTELTTGNRLYTLLRQHTLTTAAQLKERFGADWFTEHLWNANLASACAFAGAIRSAVDGGDVITPAPFAAPGWTQHEYLAFWETLIRTRIHAVWFNDAWQFSNGCTFEFAVAQDQGLPTFDAHGARLTLVDGVALIDAAVASLEQDGFDTRTLQENRDRLAPLLRTVETVPAS
jgi:hypothetical protein